MRSANNAFIHLLVPLSRLSWSRHTAAPLISRPKPWFAGPKRDCHGLHQIKIPGQCSVACCPIMQSLHREIRSRCGLPDKCLAKVNCACHVCGYHTCRQSQQQRQAALENLKTLKASCQPACLLFGTSPSLLEPQGTPVCRSSAMLRRSVAKRRRLTAPPHDELFLRVVESVYPDACVWSSLACSMQESRQALLQHVKEAMAEGWSDHVCHCLQCTHSRSVVRSTSIRDVEQWSLWSVRICALARKHEFLGFI